MLMEELLLAWRRGLEESLQSATHQLHNDFLILRLRELMIRYLSTITQQLRSFTATLKSKVESKGF
jgi:hypothetical protein